MDDPIVAFLRARLDEKEKRAGYVHDGQRDREPFGGTGRCVCGWPGRQLREVEAMREILAAYIKVEADGHRGDGWIALRFAVETLAGAWGDHPDYRPEWKD